jgi:hypothetical protein
MDVDQNALTSVFRDGGGRNQRRSGVHKIAASVGSGTSARAGIGLIALISTLFAHPV